MANSAALLNLLHLQLDMVRVGTLLYGQYPLPGLTGGLVLRDPWSFKARVSYVKELPPGHGVGYGRTFVTRRPTRVAVLPVGYADGLSLEPVLKPASFPDALKGMAKIFLHYLGWQGAALTVTFPRGGEGFWAKSACS
jgi:alanine racemase